ncbi:GNAT family N-acetyltransferase [Pseudomonas sp. 39004]|jgi:ribosomal protein S18 acetylase RimI-like enzyme|uniref:GNAT family N-acetyltransferase n=1 Tax=unclassified Pseudomonas TaxID=196821 RepID=UPI0023643336|nr:GNAT family N-acetyltransferase [Pseudomonas sp. 39004]MDD1963409.1 GNAT family N-acetyltransferase [Pseudomonas sp. 39004]
MQYTLQHLEDRNGFQASFNLMRELRPHVTDRDSYVQQLLRQAGQGYRLLAAWEGEQVVGLAGYREMENLLYGRFVYVDDLVVQPDVQRSGLGARLLGAVREEAVQRGCAHFVLDTGLHMPLAQRFYFRQGLLAHGMHFTQRLQTESQP